MIFDYLEPDNDGFISLSFQGRTEALLTNLDAKRFSPKAIKPPHARRWEIEISFRSLKYAVGLVYR